MRDIIRLTALALCCLVALTAFPFETRAESTGVSEARVAKLARGVGLPFWLWLQADPPLELNERIREDDPAFLRSLGFTHVRIPIEFANLYDKDQENLLNPLFLGLLERGIVTLLENDLAVIVDIHSIHLGESAWSDYSGPLARDPEFVEVFVAFWSSLADQLSKFDPENVFLEPLNEPVFLSNPEDWPPIQERLINAIRENAPEHTILATSAHWSSLHRFLELEPLDDPNIIYNFHFYEPHYFTHQGATWSTPILREIRDVPYPSDGLPENLREAIQELAEEDQRADMLRDNENAPWNAELIEAEIAKAAEWGRQHGVPVICNEFGALRTHCPPDSRARWLKDVRQAFEKHGIGWAMWDFDTNFGLVERDENNVASIEDDIREALGLNTP